jgi:hypothetical protein
MRYVRMRGGTVHHRGRDMRTKKVLVVVTALIALLAIGSATVATAKLKKKKIPSTITLAVNVTPGNPYAPYTPAQGHYSGQVFSKGPTKCRSGRRVTVFRNGTALGQVGTLSNGSYSLVLSSPPPAPGTYVSTVKKRKVIKKKKNKKFICKGSTSNTVVVP